MIAFTQKFLLLVSLNLKATGALLLDEIIYIKTDEIKAKKVMNAIITKIDSKTLQNLYIVFLSNNKDAGTIALRYTKTAFKLGKDIHSFLI